MAAHASQIPADSFFLAADPEIFTAAFGVEWFIRRDAPVREHESSVCSDTSEPRGPVAQRPVRRPGRVGRDREARHAQQHVVVVHPPAREVAPRRARGPAVPGCPRRRGARRPRRTPPADADRRVRCRVGVVFDPEQVGELAQGQESRPDAQPGLRRPRDRQRRLRERGTVEHRAGRGDPRPVGVGRAEERRGRRTSCGSRPAPRTTPPSSSTDRRGGRSTRSRAYR